MLLLLLSLLLCRVSHCLHQALNNLLSALADIEESNMTADEIRQLLHLPPTKGTTKAVATAGAAAPTSTSTAASGRTGAQVQQQQQALGRQQQQQQAAGGRTSSSSNSSSSNSNTSRPMSPDSLQATARQLGQLSPELAQEWYDRALRQGLQQVRKEGFGIDGGQVQTLLCTVPCTTPPDAISRADSAASFAAMSCVSHFKCKCVHKLP